MVSCTPNVWQTGLPSLRKILPSTASFTFCFANRWQLVWRPCFAVIQGALRNGFLKRCKCLAGGLLKRFSIAAPSVRLWFHYRERRAHGNNAIHPLYRTLPSLCLKPPYAFCQSGFLCMCAIDWLADFLGSNCRKIYQQTSRWLISHFKIRCLYAFQLTIECKAVSRVLPCLSTTEGQESCSTSAIFDVATVLRNSSSFAREGNLMTSSDSRPSTLNNLGIRVRVCNPRRVNMCNGQSVILHEGRKHDVKVLRPAIISKFGRVASQCQGGYSGTIGEIKDRCNVRYARINQVYG
jgi:hypothetical protein